MLEIGKYTDDVSAAYNFLVAQKHFQVPKLYYNKSVIVNCNGRQEYIGLDKDLNLQRYGLNKALKLLTGSSIPLSTFKGYVSQIDVYYAMKKKYGAEAEAITQYLNKCPVMSNAYDADFLRYEINEMVAEKSARKLGAVEIDDSFDELNFDF